MKTKLLLSVLIFFVFITANQAQNELNFELDYARFNYDSVSVYLEFYYELSPSYMTVQNRDDGKVVEAIVHVELKNIVNDTYFINKDWKIQNVLRDVDTNGVSRSLTGVFGIPIPEGEYVLLVKAYDSGNLSLGKTINERIKITPYKTTKYSVSDIELALNIKTEGSDPNSLFYKNTVEVVPNPSMLYSHKTPILFYYAEMYNLALQDSSAEFVLQKLLYNSAGSTVYKQQKNIKQGQASVVEIGLVNLSKLPTDSYNLVFSLIDSKTKEAFISAKRFYLYNPDVVDSTVIKRLNAGLMGSEFAIYNNEECDKMFSQAKYISAQKEIEQYAKLDSVNAKREFLFNFWNNRDTDPATPNNEFKEDYMRRVVFANKNFGRVGKEGYLTDRGRIYLTYGEPDQRDLFPNEQDLKPYEVWFYNQIEGGVSFIFGDLTGFGNYELLHSTKRGEVKDENYTERLKTE